MCTYIQVFIWTPGFFLRGKFIPKIAIFGDFGGPKAFFKATKVKVSEIVGRGKPSPTPNFVKID